MVKNTKGNLEDEVDALFKLPLAEFTGARNALATRLKQGGHTNDANLVKTLAKPSISAWAVNQLYWNHREPFDSLLAAGQRFRKAQLAGKVADMRAALDTRRQAISDLSDRANSVLADAGHNPSLDTLRRITTTLEALSALASLSDGPTPGRLTNDVDPPGFESLASFVPSTGTITKTKEASPAPAPQKTAQHKAEVEKQRQREETRQVRIAAARVSLQTAKKTLVEARAKVQRLESAQKKASADAKDAEKERREAEDRLKKTRAASEEATARARSIGEEAKAAARAVEEAKRTIEKATKELESLFREAPER